MHAFIDKPGYPVITNEGDNFEKFSQRRFLLDGKMKESDWPLPEIKEDMSGHYILNLTDGEFNERLEDFEGLGIEEKLRLLIDRNLITESGMQSPAGLIPLAMKFRYEVASAVWNKVAVLIANLRKYFDEESDGEKLLKKYTLLLIDDKLGEIGLVTRVDDDEDMIRLRANLMGLDYFAEDKKRFNELVRMYDDDYCKMDKEIRDDILSAKVYLEPEIVNEFLEKYRSVTDPDVKFDYLSAACLVKDDEQLKKLIMLLGNYDIVKPQDQLYLFVYLYRNIKSRKQAFDWLISHWESIKKTGGDKTLSDYPMIIARIARTEAEYQDYKSFFEPMVNDFAVSRAIKIGLNEIRARVDLISKYQADVSRALSEYMEKKI